MASKDAAGVEMPDGTRRNPPWERDERILALALYMEAGLIDGADPRIVALSELLNQLPLHPLGGDHRFRNPNSVHLKLANFAAIDPSYPGGGMTHIGRADILLWDEYQADREGLDLTARAIREEAGRQRAERLPPAEDEELAREGRLLFRRHRVRERETAGSLSGRGMP